MIVTINIWSVSTKQGRRTPSMLNFLRNNPSPETTRKPHRVLSYHIGLFQHILTFGQIKSQYKRYEEGITHFFLTYLTAKSCWTAKKLLIIPIKRWHCLLFKVI